MTDISHGQVVHLDHDPPRQPVPGEASAIIQVIERAAMNPAVDIDKMERLLQMQERVLERNARAAYAAALARMQTELPVIRERGGIKDKNGRVQSKYALWEDINEAIKPILARHGFSLSFRTGHTEGSITVTGVLLHCDGHSEETTMRLPLDTSGSKNSVQAVGSSVSYGKRYTAGALLNFTSTGEDDDGRAAAVRSDEFITDEQYGEICDLLHATQANVESFLKVYGIESVGDLKASQFKDALGALKRKQAAQEARAKEAGQ